MNNKTIGVAIVTWNGWTLLKPCLETLAQQTIQDQLLITVVDNGSTDGTVEQIKALYPEIHCISLSENQGFAGPNNLAIADLLAHQSVQYVLTLNNDIELTPTFIESLVNEATQHEQVGAIQGKLYRKNSDRMIDCVGMLVYPDMSAMNKGQHQSDHGQFDQAEEIFGASASAALYTRKALETTCIGGKDYFDSTYFAYFEDVQLAWKLRLAGFQSWYTPTAVAYHAHSATGKSHSPFKAYHIHRNHYYNIITLLPLPFLFLALALMPLRYVLLVTSVLRRKGASAQLATQAKGTSMIGIVFKAWREIAEMLPTLYGTRRAIHKIRVVRMTEIGSWYKKYKANIHEMIYG